MIEVERHFRPEFLNRIDELIIFNPLTTDDLRSIIQLQLKEVFVRLSERGIALTLEPAASEFLIKKGFNEDYGARPLRRAIERYIEDPLAEELLRTDGLAGLSISVGVEEDGENLLFDQKKDETPEPEPAAAATEES